MQLIYVINPLPYCLTVATPHGRTVVSLFSSACPWDCLLSGLKFGAAGNRTMRQWHRLKQSAEIKPSAERNYSPLCALQPPPLHSWKSCLHVCGCFCLSDAWQSFFRSKRTQCSDRAGRWSSRSLVREKKQNRASAASCSWTLLLNWRRTIGSGSQSALNKVPRSCSELLMKSRGWDGEAWTVGSVFVHSGRGMRTRGGRDGAPPGVAEPPPPCARLSSNGKATRLVRACPALFFTAAVSREACVLQQLHTSKATEGCNDVRGQIFLYTDLIIEYFLYSLRPLKMTCSVSHALWGDVNILLTFAAVIHPIWNLPFGKCPRFTSVLWIRLCSTKDGLFALFVFKCDFFPTLVFRICFFVLSCHTGPEWRHCGLSNFYWETWMQHIHN